jgi:MFS family permease
VAPVPLDLTSRRLGVAAAFLVQGFLFITLTTHLPQTKERFGLGEVALSLVLLGVVLLAGAGSVVAERLAARRDSAFALRVGLLLLAVGLAAFALLPGAALALGFGTLYGLGLGIVDAAGNMQAVALEHAHEQPLLPSFHAAWTGGGILATLLALVTGNLGPTLSVAPFAVLAIAAAGAPMLARDHGEAAVSTDTGGIPWRRIALVGVTLVLFYMVDTASTAWGPVYLHAEFGTAVGNVAIATLPYLLATLLARVTGDWTVRHFGVVGPLRVGAVIACGALATLVLAPSAVIAVVGFAILGFGIGVVAPLSFSAAGAIAGGEGASRAQVDAVIARFNQFNYLGALLGAVVTGLVGAGSLRWGFALPMVLVLGILPLASSFRARHP